MSSQVSGSLRASRILITIATLVYGVIPLLVDLTETHVFHPDWPPHARFHMVWLLGTNSMLALLALYLLWVSRLDAQIRARIAGLIGLCVYGGFIVSTLTRNAYGGALVDPAGGVPPLMGMDANLLVFLPMLLLVVVGLWMGGRRRTT
jgi:small-conductance mechanosensitive channel